MSMYDDPIADAPITDTLRAVAFERHKQRGQWSETHDDSHRTGDLALAAAHLLVGPNLGERLPALGWATELSYKHGSDRRRQLVIAAALAIAEIERLDRVAARVLP